MSDKKIEEEIKILQQQISNITLKDIDLLKQKVSALHSKINVFESLQQTLEISVDDILSTPSSYEPLPDNSIIEFEAKEPSDERVIKEQQTSPPSKFGIPTTQETLEEILSEHISEPVFVKREDKNEIIKQLYLTNNDISVDYKLDFIKHLFNGAIDEYLRVFSQINTFRNAEEALNFIDKMVKPDYNWDNKKEYEYLFKDAIKNRYKRTA